MATEKKAATQTTKSSAVKATTAPAKATKAAKAVPAIKAVTASPAPAKPRKPAVTTRAVSPEQRIHYIEVAAFYIAQRRDFAPGDPLADWIAAEAEIDQLLAQGRLG